MHAGIGRASLRRYFESDLGEAYYIVDFIKLDERLQAYEEKHHGSRRDEIRRYFTTVRADLTRLLSVEG